MAPGPTSKFEVYGLIDPVANKPLRIAVAGLRGIPNVMGGIESHCEELYPRMLAESPELAITCAARSPYVPEEREYAFRGVVIKPLPSTRSTSLEALINTFVATLYFGFLSRPDIYQIHAIGPGLLTPLARLLGMRVVVTHHGRDYNRAKWSGIGKFTLRAGEWLSLRCAHRVIVVAETLAEDLRREFPGQRDRIVYIPNGVSQLPPPAEGGEDALTAFGLEAGNYILSVGRLVPEKGFQDLIDAHTASGDPRPLVIAGGADHEGEFARSLRAQGTDRVRFIGRQPREYLARLYAECALFVLASHHEGLPIAALEAAAFSAPLLLSDIAPNRDLMLPPVNYFPVGNVTALGEALRADPARLAIDGAAVRARFDWNEIAAATTSLYRHMAARRA